MKSEGKGAGWRSFLALPWVAGRPENVDGRPNGPVRFRSHFATVLPKGRRGSPPPRSARGRTGKRRMPGDKQLSGVTLASVLEKRRLDQALNAKEFAVLAGISYSKARVWFCLPGFPALRGVVFWSDFTAWRRSQAGFESPRSKPVAAPAEELPRSKRKTSFSLPGRAARILAEAG